MFTKVFNISYSFALKTPFITKETHRQCNKQTIFTTAFTATQLCTSKLHSTGASFLQFPEA